ncbi:MAG: M3 family metallopeptidase [Aquificae bacterium]|nr:M3 family metallopeptidase [Aquificota bacterium]
MFLEFKISQDNLAQEKEKVLNQIEENKKTIEKLLKIENKTYQNFVKPYQLIHERLNWYFKPIAHLNYVKNSKLTQEVYTQLLPVLTTYYTELGQNQQLYQAFKHIYNTQKDSLTQAQKKVLEDLITDFELNGVNLAKEKKEKLKNINIQLSNLQNQFAQNLLDATDNYEMLIENYEDIKELPQEEKNRAKTKKGEKTVYRFTLHAPSYISYMTYGSNREKRQQLYKAYVTRASQNEKILEQILKLRHEKANLLGFKNYAELSLKKKMASSPEEVLSFLKELAKKSKPKAEEEFQQLKEFAKKHGLNDEFQAYDLSYYTEKLKKETLNINEEEFKPYFEKNKVIEGLFEFLNKLFKLQFKKVNTSVWHEKVDVYDLYKNDKLIGRLYMDLEAREGKRDGAWMDEWVTHCTDEECNTILPIAFIVANFSPSTEELPSLLRHYDVVTLFHEMGHALHHLLSEVEEPFVSGISGVEWDAVEFPSQFLENFAYDKEVLSLFAKHYKTGEPLPKDKIEKLQKLRNFLSGMAMVRQLEFALFDLLIHMDSYTAEEVQDILNKVREEVAVIKPPPYNKFQWSFSHIFAGGYAAGYYSYKWAEVLSADAYFMFIDNGIYNDELADSFYEEILKKGGSKPAKEIFYSFAKRQPDINAILRLSGITNEKNDN